ncbi:hypothetical protein LJR219_001285 [Phenylobacterium sp. LjRoot219]|uniref:hypothetical protein n=1 Tax=Phenylobacterium sp. LjRoot219 TaxID=3342283 RepID=UPI003ED012DE
MNAKTPTTAPTQVEVATGDRHDEVHFEPDPNQLVVAWHLVRPAGPPVEDPAGHLALADSPPVEDVLVAPDGPDGPSVWDARPADDTGKR